MILALVCLVGVVGAVAAAVCFVSYSYTPPPRSLPYHANGPYSSVVHDDFDCNF